MAATEINARAATSDRIADCAQRLTDEHGLDGFTMDDLAAAAGVSRRTLFNHFPGKVDAAVGVWPTLDDDDVERFRRGGPHHDLLDDLRTLVLPMFADQAPDRETVERGRRILLADSRLVAVVHARYQALSTAVVGHIAAREGPTFAQLRARVAVNLLAAIFDSALEEYLDDPLHRPLTVHFDEGLRTARSLLGR